jgi:hypothetical protein
MDIKIKSDRGLIELLDMGIVNLETENNGFVRKYRINGNGVVIKLKK